MTAVLWCSIPTDPAKRCPQVKYLSDSNFSDISHLNKKTEKSQINTDGLYFCANKSDFSCETIDNYPALRYNILAKLRGKIQIPI